MTDGPTRHPLSWPAGIPRTPFGKRQSSWRFKMSSTGRKPTFSEALHKMLDQLRMMGVDLEEVVVSTNVPLRLDGLPRANKAPTSPDPGVAVYWLDRDGHTMSMACDHYDTVMGNMRGLGLTMEAFRAIERHGGSRLLDQAFAGFKALPAAIPLERPWYHQLGFAEPPGTYTEAKAAYRERIAEHHPDTAGEDDRATLLNLAHEAAKQHYGV